MKTRLAKSIGFVQAAELAEAMLCDVWQTVSACPDACPILATVEHGRFPLSVPPENVWLQGEGDLGARIERILQRALQNASAAIALGADTPLLTTALLNEALSALKTFDSVIGPAQDGGFYLLGLRKYIPGLLAHLPWSTSETAAAAESRLQSSGFSVAKLPQLFDLDTPEDLSELLKTSGMGPATRAWIEGNRYAH